MNKCNSFYCFFRFQKWMATAWQISCKLNYKESYKTVKLKLPLHTDMFREMNSIIKPLYAKNNKQLSNTFKYSSTTPKKKN